MHNPPYELRDIRAGVSRVQAYPDPILSFRYGGPGYRLGVNLKTA